MSRESSFRTRFGKAMVRCAFAAALAVGLMPLPAFADEAPPSSELIEQLADKMRAAIERAESGDLGPLDPDAYQFEDSGVMLLSANESFPETFDLREKGWMSPVKFQNPFGTCWGFAAVAAAESSIASEFGIPSDQVDLSEHHLAWFALTELPDDDPSGQGGEGAHFVPNEFTTIRLNTGGWPFTATSVFSSGIGPVAESDEPGWEWTKYRNKEGLVEEYNDMPYCYSEEGDWSIDEENRFIQSYELEETSTFPDPALFDSDGAYTHNQAADNAIKGELVQGRAVSITFFADASMPGDTSAEFINTDTWAHYTNEHLNPNHAVAIVGWNDGYSKENFLEGKQPPEDGAWLVKNSWGAATEEFPNENNWGIVDGEGNNTGCFWLSYYDQSLLTPESMNFDSSASTESDYYVIHQYDYLPSSGVTSATNTDELSMANVFYAEEDQEVRSLSVETATPNSEVTFELYLLDEGFENPRDGVLLEQTTQTFAWGGYHRINLNEAHALPLGSAFSVVVTQKTPSGYYTLLTDASLNENFFNDQGKDYGRTYYLKGVVNEGESFVCNDGVWADWTEVIPEVQDLIDLGDWVDFDNFGIKAYADPIDIPSGGDEPGGEEPGGEEPGSGEEPGGGETPGGSGSGDSGGGSGGGETGGGTDGSGTHQTTLSAGSTGKPLVKTGDKTLPAVVLIALAGLAGSAAWKAGRKLSSRDAA